MEENLKQLLLKDLCARLPYGVKGIITYDKSNTTFTVEGIDNNILHLSDAEECYVEDFKPYLRPMTSMTTEEEYEYHQIRKRNSDKALSLMNCSDHLQQLLFPIIVGI